MSESQTPNQNAIMRPHLRAVDPHPQYLLRTDFDEHQDTGAGLATTLPAIEGVGAPGVVGVGLVAARADHRHEMPGSATAGAAGFMSAADKAILDSLGPAVGAATVTAASAAAAAAAAAAAVVTLSARVDVLETGLRTFLSDAAAAAARADDLERRFRILVRHYVTLGLGLPPGLQADFLASMQ